MDWLVPCGTDPLVDCSLDGVEGILTMEELVDNATVSPHIYLVAKVSSSLNFLRVHLRRRYAGVPMGSRSRLLLLPRRRQARGDPPSARKAKAKRGT